MKIEPIKELGLNIDALSKVRLVTAQAQAPAPPDIIYIATISYSANYFTTTSIGLLIVMCVLMIIDFLMNAIAIHISKNKSFIKKTLKHNRKVLGFIVHLILLIICLIIVRAITSDIDYTPDFGLFAPVVITVSSYVAIINIIKLLDKKKKITKASEEEKELLEKQIFKADIISGIAIIIVIVSVCKVIYANLTH